MTRVAFVITEPRPEFRKDLRLASEALVRRGATVDTVRWGDPEVRWGRFDRVVVHSARGRSAGPDFLEWADRIGPEVLRNPPALLRWNSDRRYLAELDGSGLPVPPTLLVAPLGPVPELHAEVVVRPVVGDDPDGSGRFRPDAGSELTELLARLGRQDRIAMVQPWLDETETVGETGLIFFGGRFAYALKNETMLPPDEADPAEVGLGLRTVEWLTGKFGRPPLHLRVNTLMTRQGPLIMEVEAIEPRFCLDQTTRLEISGAELFADALLNDPDLT